MKIDKILFRRYIFRLLVLASLLAGGYELICQERENRAIKRITQQIIADADATTNQEKIIAIRQYLQKYVTYINAPLWDNERPFLRATALETLESGKGYCGEVSRTFINMAASVGVRAQRINLDGINKHVVAEAEIAPGNNVIVDCQFPPQIKDLEPLDRVILRPEYSDYYTLNLRRLRLNWLIARVKTEIGWMTWWTENPHLLKATGWFGIGFGFIGLAGLRRIIRILLRKRGYVHVTNLHTIAAVIPDREKT